LILEKDYDCVAKWNKENNRWDISDQILYRWINPKKKPISDWYKDLTDALNFIIEHDIQSRP
jgi:hypothetical protein